MLGDRYLRVWVPQTTNGITPVMGPDGRIVEEYHELPLDALKHIERENDKLPDYLKKRIEKVEPPVYQPQQGKIRSK